MEAKWVWQSHMEAQWVGNLLLRVCN